MLIHKAKNFNVRYKKIQLTKLFGDQSRINDIGSVFISNSNKADEELNEFTSISPLHGRACTTFHKGKFYSLKGTGWTFGAASHFMSPTHEGLYYGLFTKCYAEKEMTVSAALEKKNFLAGRVIGYGMLGEPFNKLRINEELIHPCVLYTEMLSPYRIADLSYFEQEIKEKLFKEAYTHFNQSLKNASTKELFVSFAKKLFKSNNDLINLGGVNDSLMWDNVTLACETVDFENIFLPDIGVNDSLGNLRLMDRQKQSYIWLYELLIKMKHVLNLSVSVSDVMLEAYDDFYDELETNNKEFLEHLILKPSSRKS